MRRESRPASSLPLYLPLRPVICLLSTILRTSAESPYGRVGSKFSYYYMQEFPVLHGKCGYPGHALDYSRQMVSGSEVQT